MSYWLLGKAWYLVLMELLLSNLANLHCHKNKIKLKQLQSKDYKMIKKSSSRTHKKILNFIKQAKNKLNNVQIKESIQPEL